MGLDITTSSIKLIELSRSGKRYRVEAYAAEATPPSSVNEKAIVDAKAVGEAIRRAAKRSGATMMQFKKAVLSLTVTPQITPDNNIIMDLVVSKDSIGELTPASNGGYVPSIDTRSVETQVLVRDGQTVVLGGIYETETRETISKVSILGDIPGVGVLFRSTSDVLNKAELLIFVTPRILNEGSSIY